MMRDRHRATRAHHGREAGFTLGEVMVAMGIVALISVAGSSVLLASLGAENRLQQSDERVREIQLARGILRNDLLQLVGRRVRDPFGQAEPLVFQAGVEPRCPVLAFTRTGWQNPEGAVRRSDLQYVEYCLEDKTLVRRTTVRMDPTPETPVIERAILTGVEALRITAVDGDTIATEWAQRGEAVQEDTPIGPPMLVLDLELEDYGLLQLRFMTRPGRAQ